jgi:hypothetical protein
VDSWIAIKNLNDFRRKLAEEKDPDKRRVLTELIAKEEQKLRGETEKN